MKQFLIFHAPVIALFFSPVLGFSQNIASADLVNSYKQYVNVSDAPPVATNDYITGNSSKTISGNVLTNDHDPKGKSLTAYLVTGSPDGEVTLSENGDFTFVPGNNFSANTTTFSYKVCNNSLCSATATVRLSFPAEAMIPLMLSDFMANYDNRDDVILNWSTSFENDIDHFDIERSFDGTTFTKVGSIQGQGTTNLSHNYTFSNSVRRQASLKNDIYYRLKQVTSDNRSATSKVLIVRVYKTRSLEMLSVTPNPAVNDIKVNVQLNEDSYVVMKLVNSAGTELYRKSVKSKAGLNTYALEGSSQLEKGMYFLETIVNSKENMLVKLMKD